MSRTDNNRQVEALLATAHKTRSGWRGPCPFCETDGHRDRKTSLSILGDGRWWCYRCSTKGRLKDAPDPSTAAARVITHVKDDSAPKVFDPPPFFVELANDDSHTFKPARDYLKSRQVSPATMRRFGIGACYDGRWFGRVIVPIRARGHEEWYGWVGRLWTKEANKEAEGLAGLKYLYPPGMSRDRIFFNQYALTRKTPEPAMLVEGAFDCFPFSEDAFATLGKMGGRQIETLIDKCKRPLAIVLDGDAWREAWALVTKLRFSTMFDQTVGAVRLPPRVDPDEVPVKELREACRECLADETWGGLEL